MTTAVKERPILFSAPMVRAILEGRKTQTRRVVKPQPAYAGIEKFVFETHPFAPSALKGTPAAGMNLAKEGKTWLAEDWCGNIVGVLGDAPYGLPGDRLWVRETWEQISESHVWYRADHNDGYWLRRFEGLHEERLRTINRPGWKSPVSMPRWASRITLEITDVRVQRLQDISEEDAKAEGFEFGQNADGTFGGWGGADSYRAAFSLGAWVSKYWNANPWVWAYTFKRIVPA